MLKNKSLFIFLSDYKIFKLIKPIKKTNLVLENHTNLTYKTKSIKKRDSSIR